MSLKSKTAVITGSTSGIGLAYAKAFAAEGANVMINGFGKSEDIEKARAGIESQFGVKAFYSPADMTKPDEIRAMVDQAMQSAGGVDILINNAGIQHVDPIEDFPVEKWDQIIAINLSAAFHAIRAVIPVMKKAGWGRIVSTASAHSLVASPFKSAYVSAKHGLVGLTKTAALELATHKITVNCISPGYVWTPLVEGQVPDTMKARGLTREQVINDVLLQSPADQGLRHARASGGDGGVPVFRRCRSDHRCEPLRGWGLDGGLVAMSPHDRFVGFKIDGHPATPTPSV